MEVGGGGVESGGGVGVASGSCAGGHVVVDVDADHDDLFVSDSCPIAIGEKSNSKHIFKGVVVFFSTISNCFLKGKD